jgi:DNA-binding response OmpR family regulator
MKKSRKHKLNGTSQRPRTAAPGSPLRDLADRFRSRRPLSQVAVEARRATARALEGEFNPRSMLPPLPIKARCGELEVDRAERRVTLAGRELPLTRREYALLLCLVDRANHVISAAELVANVWDLEDDYDWNLLHHYIRRLRQKFGAHANMVETIRGVGYCLRPPRET